MKAVTLGDGGVEIAYMDTPSVQPDQVLVKVLACGMTRSDLLETQGQSYGDLDGVTKVLGGEFAGEVVEVGTEAKGLRAGDRVMCRGASGWAEYAVAHWRRAIPFGSEDISWEQASCVQGILQTMHDAIVTIGRFKAGQSILIQGASSATGLMGLQVGRAMGARLVIGTSTNAGRKARLVDFGANLSIDSSEETWLDQVLDVTEGKGVDVTIDMLSGDFVNKNMAATAVNGYVINIGRLAGKNTNFDCEVHAARRLHYVGTTARSRTIDEHAEVARRANDDLWGSVELGDIVSPIDRVFPLEDTVLALQRMNANEHFGKIVLLPGH